MWVASASEIAAWWRRRASVRLSFEARGRDAWVVRALDELGRSLEPLGQQRRTQETLGIGQLRVTGTKATTERNELVARGPKIPGIAVSRRSSASAISTLANLGYHVAVTDDRAGHALALDLPDYGPEDERGLVDRVASEGGAVARIAPWPAGTRGAITVSGDLDALSLADFARRVVAVSAP
jgi:hypothetical protein